MLPSGDAASASAIAPLRAAAAAAPGHVRMSLPTPAVVRGTPMSAMRHEKIGRYEVLETLARGGMGVVYKAQDPLIDRVVAIKTLGFGLSPIEAEAFRKRFAREAKSAGRLNHPNIVTIHDMGESDDGAYIAMEFLEGRTLRDILDSGVVLPPAVIADIVVQVADGLAFAHQNDVVHCDIKPANIMVLENGTVKIMDFGIARLPTGSRTFAGNVLGSPRYISPEQIVGRPVDARSDIFALGAVLYEMLTGVPPFAGTAIDEILYQVINEKPQPPSVRNRSLPAGFDEIVARAMAKHADDRYQRVAATSPRRCASSTSRPQRTPMALPPMPASAPKPASPGGCDRATRRARARARQGHSMSAAAPPHGRAAGCALHWRCRPRSCCVVPSSAWMLLSPIPAAKTPAGRTIGDASGDDGRDAATSSATARAAEPAVIPPLNRAIAGRRSDAAPPMESNTIAAPVDGCRPSPHECRRERRRAARVRDLAVGRGLRRRPQAGRDAADDRAQAARRARTRSRSATRGFAPYAQTVELGADATLRIKHKFR